MPKVPTIKPYAELPRIPGHHLGTRNMPTITIAEPHWKSKNGAVKTIKPAQIRSKENA